MHLTQLGKASHIAALLALSALLGACPGEPADDDDSSVAGDDDDSTAPPVPLADVLGVVNLTNVRQPEGTDYVDLGGAFGDFAGVDLGLVNPTAYMGSWGTETPLWRLDLGSWPLPALGEDLVLDLFEYEPWNPADQTWWDAGDRIAVGPYLSLRYADDTVVGYQVDDPLTPGGQGWTSGGAVSFGTSGGAEIVAWTSPADLALPQDMELIAPLPSGMIETPSAQQFTVQWNPKSDGAVVTVVLFQGLNVSYIANVPDSGEHTIPSTVLHDDFGAGPVNLIVSRMIESVVPHPQGDVLLRARSEERAELMLLEDLVLAPAHGSAGQTFDVDVRWFTGSIDAATVLDFGDGVTVDSVTPDVNDPQRATVALTLSEEVELGSRTVTLTNGGESIEALDAFTILNLDPADTCASADALGPLDQGTYISTTDGLENSVSSGWACLDWSLNGSDAVYAVQLEAGVTVRLAATMADPGDAALVLLSTCGAPETAVACADDGFEGDTEEILFTPEATGTYYVVVDGYFLSGFGSPSSPFELTVEELEAASPVTPPWIVTGETTDLSIESETAWDAGVGAADVDLGSDVTTNTATASSTTLAVNGTAGTSAATGPRDVTVQDGPTEVVLESALYVTQLPSNDTCAAADLWGPTGWSAGTDTAWSAGTTNALDDTGCFAWTSPGREVVHALDLVVGDSLTATLDSVEDSQLYVVTDCGDVANTCISEASSDVGFDGETESITDWVVPATGRYYLVVDLFVASLNRAWEYDLTVDVQ